MFKNVRIFVCPNMFVQSSRNVAIGLAYIARCSSSYIGETYIDEHVRTDKNSHVFKHLHSNQACLKFLNKDCFEILDSSPNHFNRKIKEALYIKWDNPNLNAQVKHYNLNLF